MSNRGRNFPIPDNTAFPVIAFVECSTGSCGMDGKEIMLLQAGSGNDAMVWEMAKNNAESYGIYPRSEYSDDEIPEDEEDNYSDNIEGNAYLFHPDNLGETYESCHQVLKWLGEIGAIDWYEGFNSNIRIVREVISRAMEYDFESFCEMIEHNISGKFYIYEAGEGGKSFTISEAETEQRSTVINQDRLFGKRDWNKGWTINELITACSESRASETSLDEMLGGDLAASEIVVIDLIEYIRELERK